MNPPREIPVDLPIFDAYAIEVDGHVVRVEERGTRSGIPAVVIHGGPGSGGSPMLRRFFDSDRYRVVCVDQRGAGLSTPRGEIVRNTTPDLLADLRRIRERLGIVRWLVVGGSWGATLAIAHAIDAPESVSALLLRSVFLARREDVDAFFAGAAIAPSGRDTVEWLDHVFREGTEADRRDAALAWWRWERSKSRTADAATTAAAPPLEGEALAACIDRYRVQIHYLAHGCWLADPPLLSRCAALPRVPTLLLHGTRDSICLPSAARDFALAAPHASLRWIDGAGHDPTHPAMAAATLEALDAYADHGRFEAPPATGSEG